MPITDMVGTGIDIPIWLRRNIDTELLNRDRSGADRPSKSKARQTG